MAAIDTNVLVRHFVDDDTHQVLAAHQLIGMSHRRGEPLFVPITVLLETEWVLRTSFQFSKERIVASFLDLIRSAKVNLESESTVERAILTYADSSADFADCLHVSLAALAGESPMWTFDKSASRLQGARRLPALPQTVALAANC